MPTALNLTVPVITAILPVAWVNFTSQTTVAIITCALAHAAIDVTAPMTVAMLIMTWVKLARVPGVAVGTGAFKRLT